MALTVTPPVSRFPTAAYSRAATFVKPMTPCFADTYGAFAADATNPWTDAVFITRPYQRSFMWGSNKRIVSKKEVKLIAIMSFHFSRGISSIVAVC